MTLPAFRPRRPLGSRASMPSKSGFGWQLRARSVTADSSVWPDCDAPSLPTAPKAFSCPCPTGLWLGTRGGEGPRPTCASGTPARCPDVLTQAVRDGEAAVRRTSTRPSLPMDRSVAGPTPSPDCCPCCAAHPPTEPTTPGAQPFVMRAEDGRCRRTYTGFVPPRRSTLLRHCRAGAPTSRPSLSECLQFPRSKPFRPEGQSMREPPAAVVRWFRARQTAGRWSEVSRRKSSRDI